MERAMSNADELEKLERLKSQGVLTDGEFEAAKQKLLGGSLAPSEIQRDETKRRANRKVLLGLAAAVAMILVWATLFGSRSDIDYSDMCKSLRVRRWAAEAVQNKVAEAGLGVRDVSTTFSALKIVHDATSEAVKHQMQRADNLTVDDVQVCAPNGNVMAYTTIVIRSGDRVGGEVLNFGIPGSRATFGEIDLGE